MDEEEHQLEVKAKRLEERKSTLDADSVSLDKLTADLDKRKQNLAKQETGRLLTSIHCVYAQCIYTVVYEAILVCYHLEYGLFVALCV